MEKKKRYCDFCGDKTNDMVCVICGKHTRPASMRLRETELQLIADDIAEDYANFNGDMGDRESKSYHSQKIKRNRLYMKRGERPYYQQESTRDSRSSFIKAISVMAMVVILVVFFFLLLGIFTRR